MNYKDKFKAQMKKAGINSLDDLKSDAEKKAFFKAVDKSHDAKNEELLAFAEEAINEFKLKDSDIEKLKQGVKQMPPIKGAKLGKPEKVKASEEEWKLAVVMSHDVDRLYLCILSLLISTTTKASPLLSK